MTTAANVRRSNDSRFYTPDGQPVFEIPKKSGDGMKKPTITDARELGLLPSVTTIIKCLHKPALQDWLIEQAVLAVLTTPRKTGENDDDFVHRVLHVEKVQDEQARTAADLGSLIHKEIQSAIQGVPVDPRVSHFVTPAINRIKDMGRVVWTEKVLVGQGYAGRSDLLLENENAQILLDWKTTGKVPEKEAYPEHLMQLAAYAQTIGNIADRHLIIGVGYISTVIPGKIVFHCYEQWDRHFRAFQHLLQIWNYMNGNAM